MKHLLSLISIFLLSSFSLFLFWSLGPLPEGGERPQFPKNLNQLRILSNNLLEYKNIYGTYTVSLFSFAYVYKQTFAIPGSFFMNLLAGALFGTINGLFIVSILNSVGASFCYLLSSFFAKSLVQKYLEKRIENFRNRISKEGNSLWIFLLSARVFPFTPHWFLNIASPIFNIPLITHFLTVLIGLLPYNFLCVRAGTILAEIRTMSDVFDTWTLLQLFTVSLIFLICARLSKAKATSMNDDYDVEVLIHYEKNS